MCRPGIAPFLLVLLLTGLMPRVMQSVIRPVRAEEPTLSDADMTYFYRSPSPARVASLITYFDALRAADRPSSRPALIGFFAAAFQRYPGDIDGMIPGSLSPQMQDLLAISLHLAGQQAKAEWLVRILKSKDAVTPDLRTTPSSLDAVQALGPSEFDLLWGASFESADPRYCSMILARVAAVANVGDNADDLVRLVRNTESGSDERWVVDKRGRDDARVLIIAASGLWALHSNAQQHPFVQTTVNEYVTAHPAEPVAKALSALGQEYGYYPLAQLASVAQGQSGKASVTVNIGYFSRILDDLSRHAGRYPPSFEFADDRPRAEHDVVTIAQLLDPLTDQFTASPPMLLRLAALHVIGFNLDVPDSHRKATAVFDKLLTVAPEDAQANFRYGAFLASTTKMGEGIRYLEKAQRLGVMDADFWLGLSYMAVGNKAMAIENLAAHVNRVPSDTHAAQMLDTLRHGRVEFKTLKNGEKP